MAFGGIQAITKSPVINKAVQCSDPPLRVLHGPSFQGVQREARLPGTASSAPGFAPDSGHDLRQSTQLTISVSLAIKWG